MTKRFIRRNAHVLPWLRALAFLVSALLALSAVPFYPEPMRPLIALALAALGLFAPAVGVLAFVIALALPLAAGEFLTGVAFLIVGLVAVQYLGERDGRAFVVVLLAFTASACGAEWALAPLAGYALGSTEGALAAFVAALALEGAGVILGRPTLGVLASGGSKPLVDLALVAGIPAPLTFGWLAPAVAKMDPARTLTALRSTQNVPLLIVQPVLWAVAGGIAGTLRKRGARVRNLAVAVASTMALAAASLAAMGALGGPVATADLVRAGIISTVVAACFAGIAEWVFPLEAVGSDLPSLRAEDADVDELLRMIANAEEALEDRHAMDATVLITDMKSFSRITQEQGTVASAKMIQRQRDLLLPVIQHAGGKGKSTGGDGLVASFASSEDALRAAVEMQRALKKYNERKPEEQRIQVRVGLASGDVIVDRSGCPFIGDSLNLAARVMGLADGGQVFAARDVVDGASDLPTPVVSHGEHTLKNILRPVDVYEVLWDEGQQPRRPEAAATAAESA